MADLTGRENRIFDLSKVRDSRFKGSGMTVADNWSRCSAVFCEWIISANTAHEGKSPFPYGLYAFQGDPTQILDLPDELQGVSFVEVIPCDRPDRRAAKLTWNETGTEAGFSFVALASLLGIDAPKNTSLWIEAVPVQDTKGKPVALLPLGERIKRQAIQQSAAAKQDSSAK